MSKSKDLNNLTKDELKELIIQQETEMIQKDKELEELKSKNIQLEAEIKNIFVEQGEMKGRITNVEEQFKKVNNYCSDIQTQFETLRNSYLDLQTTLNSIIGQEGMVLTLGEAFNYLNCDITNNSASY